MTLTKDYILDEKYELYQDNTHFRVNTDTKLLSKFMQLRKNEIVLDIGTNNGALLRIADTYPVKELIGIEVLTDSFQIAKKNAECFFKHPYTLINERVQDVQIEPVDVIVCNPPYFTQKATNPNTHMDMRQLGRIEENLTLHELIYHANRLLKSNGRFYFVHRPNRMNEIYKELQLHHFQIKSIQLAYTKNNPFAKSILIEAIKEGQCDCSFLEPIYI